MSTPGITKGTKSNMNHLRARRVSALALTVGITALCVAACGSSSSTGSSSSSSSSASAAAGGAGGSTATRTKLIACLKSHGVTLPTRPAGAGGAGARGSGAGGAGGAGAPPSGSGTRPRGGGFFGGGGAAGRFANNPKLQAAFKACGGTRGFAPGRRFGFNHAAVTKFVACVKQHGYDLPAPNFSGKGSVFPASIQKNKKFQAASKACAADLRPTGAGSSPGAGGAPPGSTSSTTGT
jgi:hypothetical protein